MVTINKNSVLANGFKRKKALHKEPQNGYLTFVEGIIESK